MQSGLSSRRVQPFYFYTHLLNSSCNEQPTETHQNHPIFLIKQPDVIMKNLKITLLAVAFLGFSLSNFASPNPVPVDSKMIVKTTMIGEKTLEVRLVNLQKEKTVLTLKSIDGRKSFHQEFIREHNGFVQVLHLENLAPGKYLLEIENDGVVQTKVIKLDSDKLLVSN